MSLHSPPSSLACTTDASVFPIGSDVEADQAAAAACAQVNGASRGGMSGAGASGASALERFIGSATTRWMPAGVSPFALVRVAQDARLVHEGAAARSIYLVQAGAFKVVRTGEDGYEQVLDFAARHDLLGCDGLADGHHASSAVALEESWAYALPIRDLQRMCQQVPEFNLRWQAALAAQIARAGEVAWLTGAVGAEKRVARFVLLYARRMAQRGESSRRLRLRMCRRDLASHLGLAHESVSRSLSLLVDAGMLRVENREIEIVDGDALRAISANTRGYAEMQVRRERARVPAAAASTPRPAPATGVARHTLACA